ncbi:hypothetical protein V6N12_063906 [Hibiscus sabdariffa]|uniref:Uncharacterized protein n=1 Tax=Hibiscus sabdariffa TaxID=183260 RepID=A0ABR2ARP1_9ROSI
MEKRVSPMASLLFIALVILSAPHSSSEAADSQTSFQDNFSIMWSEDHFKTSEDGNTWFLSLDKETGNTIVCLRTLLSASKSMVLNLFV